MQARSIEVRVTTRNVEIHKRKVMNYQLGLCNKTLWVLRSALIVLFNKTALRNIAVGLNPTQFIITMQTRSILVYLLLKATVRFSKWAMSHIVRDWNQILCIRRSRKIWLRKKMIESVIHTLEIQLKNSSLSILALHSIYSYHF